MNRTNLICNGCKKEFYPKSGHLKQKYCSRLCGYKYRCTDGKKGKKYPHTRKSAVRNCKKCGKEFRAVNDRNGKKGSKNLREQKYCSRACWETRNPQIKKICESCKNEFKTYNNKQLFCSHKCLWVGKEYPKGENSPGWKDGSSLKNERARSSGKLNKWRIFVYKRDNYTCQKCGKKNCYLNAHHIKSFTYSIQITLIFTVVSIIRSYTVRRIFNR